MHKNILNIIRCTLLIGALSLSTLSISAQQKKTVLIIMDGIPTDMIYNAYTPNLDRIRHNGVLLESYVGGVRNGYSETPTISSNGYATHLIGTWVHKHNVWDNSINEPNYHYPSMFRLFKDSKPDGKIAIYSTWLDNRTKLLGEGLKGTDNLKFDYHFDGLELDTVAYPHDDKSNYIKRIDTAVALEAAKSIYRDAPDMSWVYLQHTDDMGHIYGEGPEFYNSISYMDGLVGLVYDSVLQRENEFGEDWLVVVVTDHGRTPLTAKHHGGQSERERNTWIVMNKKEINQYATERQVAAVDVLPTICDFMDVKVDDTVLAELDGTPLLRPVDAANLSARLIGDQLILNWNAYNKDSTADVFVTFSNNFAKGGKDEYKKVGQVPVKEGSAVLEVSMPQDAKVMKILLKTKTNTLNYWISK